MNLSDETGYVSSPTDDNNSNGIFDYLEIRWVEMTNRYRCVLEGKKPRDVTDEDDRALNDTLLWANISNAILPLLSKDVFYKEVNHNGHWDIKRKEPWEYTIGTAYPGSSDTVVIYHGHYYTPEILGNYTYGAIGNAVGFWLPTLFEGSLYAAGYPKAGTGKYDNEMQDWLFIAEGYYR